MFDVALRRLVDPILVRMAVWVAGTGISANALTIFGAALGLGAAIFIAQSLGLALSPYPRSPEAEKMLKAAGVKSEEDVVPTGALAGLKDLLAKK